MKPFGYGNCACEMCMVTNLKVPSELVKASNYVWFKNFPREEFLLEMIVEDAAAYEGINTIKGGHK